MWVKKTIIVILAVLFSGDAFAVTYEVDVRNITKGTALAEYPITVKALKLQAAGEPRLLGTSEARTDEKGFSRGPIEVPAGSSLVAEVTYRGVTYRSDPAAVSRPDETLNMTVPVYEITDSRDGVSIPSRRMVVLIKNDRMLEIFETFSVINTGKHAYVGKFNNELDMNQVLFVPMPRGYILSGFSGYDRPRLRTSGRGIITQNEVLPGTNEINMRYYVQSDIGMFDLSLYAEKDAPETQMMTLFFPSSESWKLKPAGFRAAGSQVIGGKTYVAWTGKPGDVTRIKVYGPGYGGGFSVWHAAILVSFAASGVFLFFSRGNIRTWRLVREEKRLHKLREQAGEYAGASGGYIRHFTDAIDGRLREIEEAFREED